MKKLLIILGLLAICVTPKQTYKCEDFDDNPVIEEIQHEEIISRGEYIRQEYNADEILLARLIYAEASATSEEDMYAVGTVVMNRVDDSRFPNTLEAVIYQKGQYSCTFNGGSKKFNAETPDRVKEIAREILEGKRTLPEDVVWQAQFKQGKGVYKKIGVHYYCY